MSPPDPRTPVHARRAADDRSRTRPRLLRDLYVPLGRNSDDALGNALRGQAICYAVWLGAAVYASGRCRQEPSATCRPVQVAAREREADARGPRMK